ncbi:hypothetical protein AHAS_Ahas19G0280400 [Arachis hypogaea]
MALTSKITQRRSFFLEVSSEMDMGELSVTFYRRFQDELSSLLSFTNCVGNELEVLIEKGLHTGIIVNGYRNFSSFYGLKLGGWLKISYVGPNQFIIYEAFDHNMKVKDFSYPSFKVSLDVKPTVASDHVIDITDDFSYVNSVQVRDTSYKTHIPSSNQVSIFGDSTSFDVPIDNHRHVPLKLYQQVLNTS